MPCIATSKALGFKAISSANSEDIHFLNNYTNGRADQYLKYVEKLGFYEGNVSKGKQHPIRSVEGILRTYKNSIPYRCSATLIQRSPYTSREVALVTAAHCFDILRSNGKCYKKTKKRKVIFTIKGRNYSIKRARVHKALCYKNRTKAINKNVRREYAITKDVAIAYFSKKVSKHLSNRFGSAGLVFGLPNKNRYRISGFPFGKYKHCLSSRNDTVIRYWYYLYEGIFLNSSKCYFDFASSGGPWVYSTSSIGKKNNSYRKSSKNLFISAITASKSPGKYKVNSSSLSLLAYSLWANNKETRRDYINIRTR